MSDIRGEAFQASTGSLKTSTAALTAPSAMAAAAAPPANGVANSVFAPLGAVAMEFAMIITDAAGETVNWGIWEWTQLVIPEVAGVLTKNTSLYLPRRLCHGVATAGSKTVAGDGVLASSFFADTFAITEDVSLLPGVQTLAQPATPNNGMASLIVPIDPQAGVIVMETDLGTAAGAMPIARRIARLPS